MLLVPMLILMSGCATPQGNCKVIPLREYDQSFKINLANEMLVAPEKTKEFVKDSIALRDAVRACKGD